MLKHCRRGGELTNTEGIGMFVLFDKFGMF